MFLLKKIMLPIVVLMLLALVPAPAPAADYRDYATEDLAAMRGSMNSATAEERAAFQSEWRQRLATMSPEERQRFSGRPAANGTAGSQDHRWQGSRRGSQGGGQGQGQRQQHRYGGGHGRRR
ncbi:MAG: hypothetical protein JRJ56_06170 [Deltaproteobacteria bacterium]|nr:hypothetical protein [Deltaproteobacteria bacterium]